MIKRRRAGRSERVWYAAKVARWPGRVAASRRGGLGPRSAAPRHFGAAAGPWPSAQQQRMTRRGLTTVRTGRDQGLLLNHRLTAPGAAPADAGPARCCRLSAAGRAGRAAPVRRLQTTATQQQDEACLLLGGQQSNALSPRRTLQGRTAGENGRPQVTYICGSPDH